MGRGGRYKVPFRRRREGVTNYYKRRKLLLSGKPRLVVRITNRYVIAQIITARPEGDVTLVHAHSGELTKYGWRGGLKNTPAAYLTGLLTGAKAMKSGIYEAILDIGLRRAVRGGRVFAVAKGAVDAGLKVPLGEGVLPSEDRVRGEHITKYAAMLDEDELRRRFSKYFAKGLNPVELAKHFDEVRNAILAAYSAELSKQEA
ncbi:MAG: 50S ribosomal protein L18 [Infirmifilum sp.]